MDTPIVFLPIPTHPQFKDLTACPPFGQWTVIGFLGNRRWWCRCSCGREKAVSGCNLATGTSTNCGCRRLLMGTRHGKSKTPEYAIWHAMLQRCYNPRCAEYHGYGGRGITVCDRWRASFLDFLNDVGPRPSPQHSIDRYPNNDGGYEPSNVRWATVTEQQNNRRTNALITHNGITQTVMQWARQLGVKYALLEGRRRLGWPPEEILTVPSGGLQHRAAFLTYQGVTKTITEWGRQLGIPMRTLRSRIRYGWPVDKVLTAPVDPKRRRRSHSSQSEMPPPT